jgi:hypothetical protein
MMHRFKRWAAFSVPGVLLLGGLSGWANKLVVVPVVAQEEPHKPSEEDPTSPADYLWQPARPELIKDEPLQVTVPKFDFCPLLSLSEGRPASLLGEMADMGQVRISERRPPCPL